jgi:Spy/CpxP family protein refolding chaperone
MRSTAALFALFALSFASFAARPVRADDSPTVRVVAQAGAAPTESAAPKKTINRLPNNYGKLDLTSSQKQKIYDAQNKYREQIEALEKQIADLTAKKNAEVEAVLTPEQKAKLADLSGKSAAKK